jgi:nucleoside-diphosphate-sugar epimerase
MGSDPAPLHHANVVGTRRVLELADEAPEAHLLHVSTAYVAGRRATGIVREDDLLDTTGFQVPYEESKYTAERLVHAWVRRNDRQATVLRPSLLVTDRPVPEDLPAQPADFLIRPLERHLRSRAERASPVQALLRRTRGEAGHPASDLNFRVEGDPQGSLNMLQADYAAHAMVRAATRARPTTGVRTLHVTHPHNVTFATAVAALQTRFPGLTVSMTERLTRPTTQERLLAQHGAPLLTYTTHRRTYDRTNLIAALDGLPDPDLVGHDYLTRAFSRAEALVAG